MKTTPKDMAVSHGNKSLLKFASGNQKVICCSLPSEQVPNSLYTLVNHQKKHVFNVIAYDWNITWISDIFFFVAVIFQTEGKNEKVMKEEFVPKTYISDEKSKSQLLKQKMAFDQQQGDIQV